MSRSNACVQLEPINSPRILSHKYKNQDQRKRARTLLNLPDARDLHLFFVPLCDFNFGNCSVDDVEKHRAVCTTRLKNENIESDGDGTMSGKA